MRVFRTLGLLAIAIGTPLALADCYTGGPNAQCCTNVVTECKDATGAHWTCTSTTNNTCVINTVIDAPPGVSGQISYADGASPVCKCERQMRSCGPKKNECIVGSKINIECYDVHRTGAGCSGV